MDEKNKGDLGTIRISDGAIAVIAGLAALEIEGVSAMAQGTVDGIAEMLGVKASQGRGVKVEVQNEEVVIDIHLIVDFGVDIPSICQKVQDNVRVAVEDMTSLSVMNINVFVQGVKRKEKK